MSEPTMAHRRYEQSRRRRCDHCAHNERARLSRAKGTVPCMTLGAPTLL
ncbi:MAG: hypothetical protein ACYCXN_15885 [Acidimicrobiales bacterium]